MSRISVKDAVKRYGNNTVIPDLNLEIGDGELFTLLGPSGCGKTTLLRMIAGFNSIEGGDIFFNEKRINDMDPSKRNIGMVFQNYAIFPNLSVRDNVAFGLKNRKVDKAEIKKRTDEFLNLMQIMQYADRMPNQLSGGQQQRIALARALVISPDVLLMDEPLSNLDAKLRVEMRSVIRHTQKSVGITTVYVTHDQEEAMAISDRIAVMYLGNVVELASSDDLYAHTLHPYSKALLSAVPIPDPSAEAQKHRQILSGDVPSPINTPKGCNFAGRCPVACDKCRESKPQLREIRPGHFCACHLVEPEI